MDSDPARQTRKRTPLLAPASGRDLAPTRILMLHRVLDDTPAAFGLPSSYRMRGTALTPAELLRALDEAGPILPLQVVEDALLRGEDPPPGAVLTFDDGYREHLDRVTPLLAARGASATFYVATGLHGEGSALAPVDAWYWLLDHARRRNAAVPLPGGGVFHGPIDTREGKAAWVSGEPKTAFLAASAGQQATMLAALAASAGSSLPDDLAARLYLRANEWSALAVAGMRVGAHSVRHPRLTQVDDQTLRDEVADSVAAIRSLGGTVTFAYPDGDVDARVRTAVETAGVSSAVTCVPGHVRPGADPLCLPRIFLTPSLPSHAPPHPAPAPARR